MLVKLFKVSNGCKDFLRHKIGVQKLFCLNFEQSSYIKYELFKL